MNAFLSQLVPLLYGACFLALLWQAFRVMRQGYSAIPRPGDAGIDRSSDDRSGRLTIHPELLDAEGRITQEDLLTVRFGDDNERPTVPGEPR